MNNGHLTVGEFERGLKSLERNINSRFDAVDERFSKFDEKHTDHAERIAVLEKRSKESTKNQMKRTTTVAGAISTVMLVLAEVGRRWFGLGL